MIIIIYQKNHQKFQARKKNSAESKHKHSALLMIPESIKFRQFKLPTVRTLMKHWSISGSGVFVGTSLILNPLEKYPLPKFGCFLMWHSCYRVCIVNFMATIYIVYIVSSRINHINASSIFAYRQNHNSRPSCWKKRKPIPGQARNLCFEQGCFCKIYRLSQFFLCPLTKAI